MSNATQIKVQNAINGNVSDWPASPELIAACEASEDGSVGAILSRDNEEEIKQWVPVRGEPQWYVRLVRA